jgi:hypothetical protein
VTSIWIKVFVSLAALSAVYTFVREMQHSGRRRRLLTWVRDHYPLEWGEIHQGRRWLHPTAILAGLDRSGAISHPHFAQEYPRVKRWPRDMTVAFAVACAAMATAILGSQYLGWTW